MLSIVVFDEGNLVHLLRLRLEPVAADNEATVP